MAPHKSEYENYIMVCQGTKMLRGTYPAFLKTKALMSTLTSMAQNNPTLILIMESSM